MGLHTNLAILTIFSVLNLGQAAKLQIVEAEAAGGLNQWKRGPVLNETNILCPTDLFRAFSIICIPDETSLLATFYIDGAFTKKESAIPYMLFGDDGVKASQWKDLPDSAVIECFLDDGEDVQAKILFKCDDEETMLPSSPISTVSPAQGGAKLQIVEAKAAGGVDQWKRGPFLTKEIVLCPTDLFPSFSVICITSEVSISVKFYIDEMLARKESVAPYVLFGDDGDKANAWKDLPESAIIKCNVDNGKEIIESTIYFECPKQENFLAPSPLPPSSAAPVSVSTTLPTSTTSSIVEAATTLPPSTTMVKKMKTTTMIVPATTVMTKKTTAPTRTPKPSVMTEGELAKCVKIPATSFDTTSAEWKQVGDGMAFKWNDPDRGIDGPGKYPLTFSFVAPITAHYAFTLDMQTSNSVDHNDVWVEFPEGGFKLLRKDSTVNKGGWVKAYHNRNGRSVEAYSVDFKPHRFATENILTGKKKYVLNISGRSTKVRIFNIVMFPCSNEKCYTGSYYNLGVEKCSNSTTTT